MPAARRSTSRPTPPTRSPAAASAPRVLVTGGGASRLGEALELDAAVEAAPTLVLEGLAVYAAHAADEAS